MVYAKQINHFNGEQLFWLNTMKFVAEGACQLLQLGVMNTANDNKRLPAISRRGKHQGGGLTEANCITVSCHYTEPVYHWPGKYCKLSSGRLI